jgi:hypothetical protein
MKLLQESLKQLNIIFAHPKLTTLLVSVVLFSILYTVLDDKHFSGVNVIKEKIKDEVIKQKIEKEVGEPEESTREAFRGIFSNNDDFYGRIQKENVEKKIDEAKKEAEKDVEEQEMLPDKIDQPITQRLFNRTYFSFTTATLLGYGDIYPITNVSKLIVMIQAFITVGLIVF